MTQDELWKAKYKYKEVMDFVDKNHRNPSKYGSQERQLYVDWLKHNRKLPTKGELIKSKAELFKMVSISMFNQFQ